MYPTYYQIGKARLADWYAQARRDALARAAAGPAANKSPRPQPGASCPSQLQSWWTC